MARVTVSGARTVAIVVGCILAACQTSSGPSVHDVNVAAERLNKEMGDYLALGQRQPPLDTPAQAQAFFDESDRRIARLRETYDHWSELLTRSLEEGHAPEKQDLTALQAYRDAVGTWISAQEEQSRLSRACFETKQISNDAAARCYRELIATKGPAWQAAADRVNTLAAKGR